MQRIRFRIELPADRFLRYYRGAAQVVVVTSDDGRRIQLPALELRPFVSGEGISGYFEMILDSNNKLLSIKKIYL